MDRRLTILHPLLFAVYPGLALLAHNRTQLEPRDALRSLLISLAAALIAWGLLSRILGDGRRAAFLTSLGLLLFFTYGHVYYLARGVPALSSSLGRHRYLVLLWAAVLAAGVWVSRRVRDTRGLHGALNWVAAGALAIPVVQLIVPWLASELQPPTATPQNGLISGAPTSDLPDIYYIILDAYAREDVLRELYDYDNSPFLDALRSDGFYVVEHSHSNYGQTSLSLSSSLNLDYVEAFVPSNAQPVDPLAPLFQAIDDSRLRRTLEGLGYKVVAFASGFRGTELRDADVYLTPGDQALQAMHAVGGINAFEGMLLQSSAGVLLTTAIGQLPESIRPNLQAPYFAHRARILFALDELPNAAALQGPKFVFLHIVSPHPPFVFGPNGEEIENTDAYTLKNGVFLGNRSTYIERYRDQVNFLNGQLEALLPGLISSTRPQPVIVIQSDHGPDGTSVGQEASPLAYIDERLSNLIAIHLGDCPGAQLYPSLTPVNVFRVILNACFGASLDLLPDRVFLSAYDSPYDLIEVTDDLRDRTP